MLFNMGIALTAEFTAIGDLFEFVIGSERWPIVVIIGVVSMIYTSWGGLYVSIITDQWQVRGRGRGRGGGWGGHHHLVEGKKWCPKADRKDRARGQQVEKTDRCRFGNGWNLASLE